MNKRKRKLKLLSLFLSTLFLYNLFSANVPTVFPHTINTTQLTKTTEFFTSLRYEHTAQTIGEVKALVLMIEFPDKRNQHEVVDAQYLAHRIFEDENEMLYPFNNLRAYYQRSSYGTLNITGDVHGWYTAQNERNYYGTPAGVQELVVEALKHFDSAIDYNDYDANGDGVIDLIYIHYAGGSEGSDSPWWSWASSFDPIYISGSLDGLGYGRFAYLFDNYAADESNSEYITTMIHETGHLFGAGDYYDRESFNMFLNNGGTFSFDMMDQKNGDHNSLSKLIYGWIKDPTVITASTNNITLSPFGDHASVAIIYPNQENLNEFFLVEYITETANLTKAYPYYESIGRPGGLRVYRVNTSESMMNNNGDGLKLIEAIHKGPGRFVNDPDYEYTWSLIFPGETVSPYGTVSTYLYKPNETTGKVEKSFSGLTIENFSIQNGTAVFDVKIDSQPIEKPIEFTKISFADNHIEITANTEINPASTEPIQLTDGSKTIDIPPYNQGISDVTLNNNTFLLAYDNSARAALEADKSYKLIIPQGYFKSTYGAVNGRCEIQIEDILFPDVQHSADLLLERFDQVSEFYLLEGDSAGRIYLDLSDTNGFRYLYHVISKDNKEHFLDLGLSYDQRHRYVGTVQLSSGDLVIATYNMETTHLEFAQVNGKGEVVGKRSFDTDSYPVFMPYALGEQVVLPLYNTNEVTLFNMTENVRTLDGTAYQGLFVNGTSSHNAFSLTTDQAENLFPLSDGTYALADYRDRSRISIVNDRLDILKTQPLSSVKTQEILLSFFDTENGYAGIYATGVQEGFQNSKILNGGVVDLVVTFYNWNLERTGSRTLMEDQSLASIAVNSKNHMTKTDTRYFMDITINPTPEKSSSSNYTKTLILDQNYNLISGYTSRISSQGVYAKSLILEDQLFIGWWNGYKKFYKNPLISLSVETLPHKMTYQKGEALDLTGLTIKKTFEDKTTAVSTITIENIYGYDINWPTNKQTLTIEIDGITTSFDIRKGLTVTFNSNGGTPVASSTVDPGTLLSPPNPPTRAGYSFTGWYRDAALQTPWDFEKDLVTTDFTLHAGWQKTVANVTYRSHIQSYGWESQWKSNGEMSGTTGQGKRLEGIEINLNGLAGDIEYRTHVQSYGWLDWVSNGEMSGTSGEAKRLEAIEIRLSGSAENQYDVYYRVHAQSFGWLDWAKNGEPSGTAGFAFRLEGIEIQLVPKNSPGPNETSNPFYDHLKTIVSYRSHVQTYGWEPNWNSNGENSGTTGEGKRLEAIEIKLNQNIQGSIRYRTHVQTYGWLDWVTDGEMSGTSGEAKRLEAIEIMLTGDMAKVYDIYYRVHAQKFGWLDWAKNGAPSGTAGFAYRLEAIQIRLVPKNGPFSGFTARPFVQK